MARVYSTSTSTRASEEVADTGSLISDARTVTMLLYSVWCLVVLVAVTSALYLSLSLPPSLSLPCLFGDALLFHLSFLVVLLQLT